MADAPIAAPAAPTAPAATTPATPGAAPAAPAAPDFAAVSAALAKAGIDISNLDAPTIKLIIDGAEEAFPIPVARNFAQKVRAADKRFMTAAEREKKFDALADSIKKDPTKLWEAAEMLGANVDDLALARIEASLKREVALARETPEQKRLREENEGFKKKEREAKFAEQEKQRQAQVQAHLQTQGRALYDAVEKTSLPHTDATALRIVAIMERGLEQGIEYDPATLAALAEQEVVDEVRAVLAAQKDVSKRRKLVGEDLIAKLLSGDVEAVAKAPGAPADPPPAPTREVGEDGSTVVRFKPKSKGKNEREAIRELTRSLKSGKMPNPV